MYIGQYRLGSSWKHEESRLVIAADVYYAHMYIYVYLDRAREIILYAMPAAALKLVTLLLRRLRHLLPSFQPLISRAVYCADGIYMDACIIMIRLIAI